MLADRQYSAFLKTGDCQIVKEFPGVDRRTALPPHQPAARGRTTDSGPDDGCRGRVAIPQAQSGGGPGEGFLADTRWGNGRWVHGELQMPEDLPDHLAVRDGRDDPQRPPLTPGTACHIQCKDALQQSCPAPARRPGVRLLLVHALLAWRGDDRTAQAAVRRSTAAIAYQMDAWQGHQGRQLLQEFHRCESNPRGPVRPWGGGRCRQDRR